MGVPRRRRAGGSTGLREMRLGGPRPLEAESGDDFGSASSWFSGNPICFEFRHGSMGRIGAPRAVPIFVEPVRQKNPRLDNRDRELPLLRAQTKNAAHTSKGCPNGRERSNALAFAVLRPAAVQCARDAHA